MDPSDVYILQSCPDCGATNRVDPARWRVACCGRCGGTLHITPRDVLGVAADAPVDEVRRAFRQRAKAWHPDHRPGDPFAAERLHALLQAYRHVLGERSGTGAAGSTASTGPEMSTAAPNARPEMAASPGQDVRGREAAPRPVNGPLSMPAMPALPVLWRVALHLTGLAAAVAVFILSARVSMPLSRAALQLASGGWGLFSVLHIALALWDGMPPARMGPEKG